MAIFWNKITGKDVLIEENERLERKRLQELRDQNDKREAMETKHRIERRDLEAKYTEELKKKDERLKRLEAEKKEVEERKLEKPWRDFAKGGGWTKEYLDKLVEAINVLVLHDRVKQAKFLIVGPIHAGKSSFINAVASIDNERIATPCEVGEATQSLSKKLTQYRCSGVLRNIEILDTMGIEEHQNEGLNFNDLIYVIEGNVKPNYKFNPRTSIDKTHRSFKANPTLADKAHGVAIVIACPVIHSDSITDATKQKIKVLEDHIRDNDVPVVILLTKIDQICEEVKEDITMVYKSRAVKMVVEKAEQLFGVPQMHIFPVRSYTQEQDVDQNKSILILLAIKKMMEIATDRLRRRTDLHDPQNSTSRRCLLL